MARLLDPLHPAERASIMGRQRPHPALPILTATTNPQPDLAPSPAPAPKPRYAVWEVTLACDHACRHCGSRAAKARPGELDTAQALDLVDQLYALGVREITLIGGEVYLRPDWLEIIGAVSRRMRCTMTTGGRGLDREMAKAAKAAGLYAVSVSVDGLEGTHDRLRGARGSYQSALRALDAVREAGLGVCTNTQINRLSMPELPELAKVLRAAGTRAWQLQLTVPMGRAADEPDVLLQPEDLLELFPMLAEIAQTSGIALWPGNNIGYFGPHEAELRKVQPGRHMVSCSAGTHSIGIEADGTIKGCPSLPTEAWAAGSAKEHDLADIWARSARLRYTRERTVDDLWGYCRECYYADVCKAGCTWTSHVFFGRPGNNPYCHHRALERARHGLRERLVRTEAPSGRPFDHGRFEVILEPRPETSEERVP